MAEGNIEVSIIITGYKEEGLKFYTRLLDELDNFREHTFEVVIIIERSQKLCKEIKKHLETSPLSYKALLVFFDNKLGLASARNLGIAYARGKIIAFLDHSVVPSENWLTELIRTHKKLEKADCIGGKSIPVVQGKKLNYLPQELNRLIGSNPGDFSEKLTQAPTVIGSNMSFKREIFSQVGGFSPYLGFSAKRPGNLKKILMGEETEICERINLLKGEGKIYYNPNMVVYHQINAEKLNPPSLIKRAISLGISTKLVKFFAKEFKNEFNGIKREKSLPIEHRERNFTRKIIKRSLEYLLNLLKLKNPLKNLRYLSLNLITSFSTFLGVLYSPILSHLYKKELKRIDLTDLYFKKAFEKHGKIVFEK